MAIQAESVGNGIWKVTGEHPNQTRYVKGDVLVSELLNNQSKMVEALDGLTGIVQRLHRQVAGYSERRF